ncbi:MAG: AMP-binding protein [Burkholderiales bacterium]|nr:AMP-binding protein [Burkholderiales bacterium]
METDGLLEGCVPFPPEFAERYRRKGYWKGRTLDAWFDEWTARFGERIAVVSDGERVTYAELARRVDRVAHSLAALGLRPRDRVLMQLNNVPEFLYVTFALLKVGALPVMALPAHREAEISHLLAFSEAVAYCAPARLRGFDYVEMVRGIRPCAPDLQHVLVTGDAPPGTVSIDAMIRGASGAAPRTFDGRRPASSDVALFMVSGGTTGLPKLIPRTHDEYAYVVDIAAETADLGPESVFLIVLPISHNFSFAAPGALGVLSRGATLVLAPSPNPEAAFPLIERERVTNTATVPAVLIQWLASPLRERHDLSSLKVIQVGGSRLNAEVAQRVKPLLGATVQQVYGMAEGLNNLTRVDDPEEVILNTQGRPLSPDDEFMVIGDDGRAVAPGERGELVTRGPYTIRGYYKAPEYNATGFTPDGFYKTGDLVRVTRSGNFSVEGRVKDLINRGGEKISAEEVENAVLRHPAVQNVAVVAMPHPVLGEAVCAYVIARPGAPLTLEALRAFLDRAGIARFKVPERIEIVERFPLTSVGKISKQGLRADITARLRAEGEAT